MEASGSTGKCAPTCGRSDHQPAARGAVGNKQDAGAVRRPLHSHQAGRLAFGRGGNAPRHDLARRRQGHLANVEPVVGTSANASRVPSGDSDGYHDTRLPLPSSRTRPSASVTSTSFQRPSPVTNARRVPSGDTLGVSSGLDFAKPCGMSGVGVDHREDGCPPCSRSVTTCRLSGIQAVDPANRQSPIRIWRAAPPGYDSNQSSRPSGLEASRRQARTGAPRRCPRTATGQTAADHCQRHSTSGRASTTGRRARTRTGRRADERRRKSRRRSRAPAPHLPGSPTRAPNRDRGQSTGGNRPAPRRATAP